MPNDEDASYRQDANLRPGGTFPDGGEFDYDASEDDWSEAQVERLGRKLRLALDRAMMHEDRAHRLTLQLVDAKEKREALAAAGVKLVAMLDAGTIGNIRPLIFNDATEALRSLLS